MIVMEPRLYSGLQNHCHLENTAYQDLGSRDVLAGVDVINLAATLWEPLNQLVSYWFRTSTLVFPQAHSALSCDVW